MVDVKMMMPQVCRHDDDAAICLVVGEDWTVVWGVHRVAVERGDARDGVGGWRLSCTDKRHDLVKLDINRDPCVEVFTARVRDGEGR